MKLEGPLMSIGAHGTIAKAITYSMRGGRARAAIYRPPHDARTQAQLNQRAHYLDGSRLWKLMTDADRLAWTQTHQLPTASGYNTFVQTILKRETHSHLWKNPSFFSDADTLQNFLLIAPFELTENGAFLDISGNGAHLTSPEITQVQGDRGFAVNLPGNQTGNYFEDTNDIGPFTELTVALMLYSDTPHSQYPTNARLITNRAWNSNDGFGLRILGDGFRFAVGDGAAYTNLTTTKGYLTSKWNSIVCTFNADNNGRIAIYLNNELIGETDTGYATIDSRSSRVWLGSYGASEPFTGRLDNAIIYKGVAGAHRI